MTAETSMTVWILTSEQSFVGVYETREAAMRDNPGDWMKGSVWTENYYLDVPGRSGSTRRLSLFEKEVER